MKGLYYKPSNFISFSGMLYKLSSNTNSLASLAVLSTGVILVVAVSCGVYISLEDSLKSNYPQDYKLDLAFDSYLQPCGSGLSHHLESGQYDCGTSE